MAGLLQKGWIWLKANASLFHYFLLTLPTALLVWAIHALTGATWPVYVWAALWPAPLLAYLFVRWALFCGTILYFIVGGTCRGLWRLARRVLSGR